MTISNILCYDTDLTPEIITANKSADVGSFVNSPISFRFNNDGTKLFVLSQEDKNIHQFSVTTAYDISSIVQDNITLSVSGDLNAEVGGFDFIDNGSILYVGVNQELKKYNLTTAYDLTTASFEFVAINSDKPIKSVYRQHNNDSNVLLQEEINSYTLRIAKYDAEAGFNFAATSDTFPGTSTNNTLSFSNTKSAEFSPDGTKVFVATNEKISQLSLGTSYDLRTVTDTVELLLSQFSCADTNIEHITLSYDGTSIYMLGGTAGIIYQFDLNTPYDILSIGTKETYLQGSPENLFFNDSGSKMYTIDLATTTIHQFSLATNFAPDSATYDSKSFDFSNQDATVRSVNFNANGTEMYLLGSQTAKIYSYTLNPAYDISTAVYTEILPNSVSEASYDSVSLNISSQSPNPKNKKFSSNGTKLYVLDYANRVDQYGLGTAYDLTTATYEKTFTFDNLLDSAESIAISDNGTKFYVLTNRAVHQFTLTTPYDITTAVSSTFIFDEISNTGAVRIENNGTKLYALDSGSGQLYQYSLASANDPSTLSYDGISFDFSNQAIAQGFDFKPDGTKMFMVANNRIYQYTLSTAFNISTATFEKVPVVGLADAELDSSRTFSVASQMPSTLDTKISAVVFGNNGNKLYVVNEDPDDSTIYQYSLSTPYDISTATYDNKSLDVESAHNSLVLSAPGALIPHDLLFNQNGTKLYVLDDRFEQILDFDLGTAFDISTASLNHLKPDNRVASGSASSAGTEYQNLDYLQTRAIRWRDNGNKFNLLANGVAMRIYTFSTDTPYRQVAFDSNPTKISQSGSLDPSTTDFAFNSDGTKLFTVINSSGRDEIREHNLSPAYDITGVNSTNHSKEVSLPTFTTTGFQFNTNGTKLFTLNNASADSRVLEMSLSSGFDINTLKTKTLPDGLTNLSGTYYKSDITFNNNGTKIYVLQGMKIKQFSLGAAYDLSTGTYDGEGDLQWNSTLFFDFRSAVWNNNGTKLYALEERLLRIYEYSVSTAYDATTISYTGNAFYHGYQDPGGMCFGDSGTKLFISDNNLNRIVQYNLSTAYDATTAGAVQSQFSPTSIDISAIDISPNGSKLTIVRENDFITYNLSTPYNLTTASLNNSSIKSRITNRVWGFHWHPNGDRFFTFNSSQGPAEYDGVSSFNVAGAEYLPVITLRDNGLIGPSNAGDFFGFDFNPSGTELYAIDSETGQVFSYKLSTPFDLNTLTGNFVTYTALYAENMRLSKSYGFTWHDNDNGFSWVSNAANDATVINDSAIPAGLVDRVQFPFDIGNDSVGFEFGDNGSKLYVSREDQIHQYSLSTPYLIDQLDQNNYEESYTPSIPGNSSVEIRDIYVTPNTDYLYIYSDQSSFTYGVYQFSLSNSNITSASYDGVRISKTGGETIDVSDDNTTLILGRSNGTIETYDLRGGFYVGNEMSSPVGIKLTNSGTRAMVLSSTADTVYQYNLSSGFDLSTTTYSNKSRSINSSFTSDLTFNDTGTIMFVTCTDGASGDSFSGEVIEYNLGTAHEINTATESSNFGIGLDSSPVSVDFSDNGTRMFALGNQHNVLLQYDLDDPYDIFPSKVNSDVFFIGRNSNLLIVKPDSIQLTSDGTKMYLGDTTRNAIDYYLLDTAFDTATAIPSPSQSVDLDNLGVTLNPIDFVINSAGDRLYVLDNLSNSVHQFTVPSIFDLSSAQYDFISTSVNSEDSSPTSLAFNNNFSKMYISGLGTDSIFQYALNGALFVGGKDNSPIGMEFLDSGTKLYVAGNETDKVHQFTLGTGFDLSTLNDYLISSPDLSSSDSNIRSFTMNSAGTQAYFAGDTTDRIYQYDLGTAYDISTASASKEIQVNFNNTTDISGVNLSGTGNSLIVSSEGNYQVYPLETNFDINSAKIHSAVLDVSSQSTDPAAFRFSETGDKLWFLSDAPSRLLYEYDLSVPNNLSTAVYNNVSGNPMTGENINFDSFQFNRSGSKIYVLEDFTNTWFQASTIAPFSVTANSDDITYAPGIDVDNFSFDRNFTKILATASNSMRVYYLNFSSLENYDYSILSSPTYPPRGFAVTSSGSKLYTLNSRENSITPVYLDTPFETNINTAAPGGGIIVDYDIQEFEVNSDGTKLFVLSKDEDIYEYDLIPEVGKIEEINGTLTTRPVTLPTSQFIDTVFNNDGTKLFVLTSADVYEYNLSTAYDLSTAIYSGISYDAPESDNLGIIFNSTGEKMFLLANNDRIYQIDLSTGFDLSTATYNNKLLNVTAQTTAANSICFNTTGSKLFVGANLGKIYEYGFTPWVEQQKLLPSDVAANDRVGTPVAIDGDILVVGGGDGTTSAGAAYVFTKSGSTWTEQQKLVASDGQQDDRGGFSVAISGDTVIFGAPGEDAGGTSAGAAYVFTTSDGGATWTQQQKLVASDASPDKYFGQSVSISGDTVVVGAYGDDQVASDAGAAYVFTRSGSTWTEQQKLVASDGQINDFFGLPVAIDGDIAIISAYGDDQGGTDAGAAYVFTRSGSTWTEQQKLVASDAESGDYFGGNLAIDGNTVIVGSPYDGSGGVNFTGPGSVYIFTTSDGGATWTQQQKLVASDGQGSDRFGQSVAVSGDRAIVGAFLEDPGIANAGAAYVFTRTGSTWSEDQKLVASDASSDASFGGGVAISGDTVAVGATGDDQGGTDAGATYIFTANDTYPDLLDVTYNTVYDLPDISNSSYFEFNPTGTELYVLDNQLLSNIPRIYRYSLSSPFIVSSAQLQGRSYVPVEPDPTDGNYRVKSLLFKDPGDTVNVITLKEILPAEIESTRNFSSIYYDGSVSPDLKGQAELPNCLRFSNDGTKMFASSFQHPTGIYQYSLTTPYDITTASYDFVVWDGKIGTTIYGGSGIDAFEFNGDGTKIYMYNNDVLFQFSLSTPYDLSNPSYDGLSYNFSLKDSDPKHAKFARFGTRLFIVGGNTDTVYQFATSNYSLGSVNDNNYFADFSNFTNLRSIALNPDASRLFVLGSDRHGVRASAIYYFDLSTPGDIRTTGNFLEYGFDEDVAVDVNFNNDGTKMYLLGKNTHTTYQYTLPAPYSLIVKQSIYGLDFDPNANTFGQALAADGNTLVVGAPEEFAISIQSGAVYIFQNINSTWTYTDKFIGTSRETFTGTSVAISGDTIVAGEPGWDNSGNQDAYKGAVQIQTSSDGGASWNFQTRLIPSDLTDPDSNGFGSGVALSGDTLVVSTNTGRFYVFTRSGTTWTERQIIEAGGGSDIAIDNNIIVSDSGNVYTTSDNGITWTLQQQLQPPTGTTAHPAISGNTIVVGSSVATVFVTDDGGESWTPQAELPEADGAPLSGIDSIAISGDTVVIGYDDIINVFTRSGSTWTEQVRPQRNAGEGTIIRTYANTVTITGNFVIGGHDIYDIIETYDISSQIYPSYDEAVFNVWSDISTDKVLFNSTGSEMIAINDVNDTIDQYTLSTPADITTALTASKQFSLSFTPKFMSWNSDGTKLIVGSYITNDRLYELTLTTAYDISTASETGVIFNITPGTLPVAVLFNNTGTKMFILDGSSDTIYQYELSNGYDISSAIYSGINVDLGALGITTNPADIQFNASGTELYYFDSTSELIHRFALNPAYDITTMVEVGIPYGRTENTNIPRGLTFFNNDFYVADGNEVYQYKSPDWSLDFTDPVYLFTGDNSAFTLTLKPDGTKLYVADTKTTGKDIYAYDLVTPFDIDTARYTGETYKISSNTSTSGLFDMEFSADGTKLFVLEGIEFGSAFIYTLTLSSAYDISSTTDMNTSTIFTTTSPVAWASFKFNNDGTKLYIGNYNFFTGEFEARVSQYNLPSPYDVQNRGDSDASITLPDLDPLILKPNSIDFNESGTMLYVHFNRGIAGIPLNQPFEIETANLYKINMYTESDNKTIYDIVVNSNQSKLFYLRSLTASSNTICQTDLQDTSSKIAYNNSTVELYNGFATSFGFRLDSTGKHVNIIDENSISIVQLELGTAFDISTAIATDKTFDVSSQETAPTSLEFDPSGSLMFVVGTASNQVHQYALSSANDVSTATFVASFDLSLVTTNPAPFDIQFNDTGSLMFILNNDTLDQQVYAYTLSVPYQIQTAVLSKILNYSDLRVDQFGTPLGINATSMLMNAVGNRLYLADSTDLKFYQYVLSIPFDLSSAEYNNEVIDIPSEVTQTTRNKFFDIDFSRKIIYFSEGRDIYQYNLVEGAFAIRPMTPAEINNLAYDVLEHLATQNQQTGNLEVTDDAGVTNTLLDTFEDTDFDPVTEQAVIESSTPFYFVDQEEYTALPSTPPDLLEYSVNGSEVSLQPSSTGRSLFEDIADIAIELMLGAGTSSPGPNTYKLVEFNESPGPGTWETVADIGDTFRIGSDPTEDISNVDFNSDGTDFVGTVQVGNFVDVDDPNSGSGTKHTMWIDQNILVSVQEITNFQDTPIGVTVRTYDINLITNTLTLIDTAVVDSQSVPVGSTGASYEVNDSLYFENTEVEFVVSVAVRAYGLNERHGYIKFNIDSSGNITNNSAPTYFPDFNSPYQSMKTASARGVQEFANGSKEHVWKGELYDFADTSSIYLVFNEGDTGNPSFSTSDPFFQTQEFNSRTNWTWDLNNITSYTAQQITNTLDQTQNNYKLLRKVAQEDKGTYPQPVKLENDTITLYASADINAIAQYIRQRIHETKKGTYDITTDGNPPDVINTWENMGSITDTRNSSTGSLTLLSTTVDVETLTLWRRTD